MNLGGPELIIMLLGIVPLVSIFALVDIARRTEAELHDVGQSRTMWLIIAIVSVFVPCLFLAPAYYLLAVRPKL